jgi:hypothetical protein
LKSLLGREDLHRNILHDGHRLCGLGVKYDVSEIRPKCYPKTRQHHESRTVRTIIKHK